MLKTVLTVLYTFLLGLGCCFTTLPLLAQSGWTKVKTEGFYQLGYNHFSSDAYFTLDGEELKTNDFTQNSLVFYGEYGVTDKFTVIANWPLQVWNGFSSTETVSGLGDLRLELKHALLKKHLPLSIAIAPEIPIGKANNFAQSKLNDFESINLPSGDGEFNIWTTLATSFSLPNAPLYVNLFGTYNFRTQYDGISFSDQIGLGIELGYKIADLVWVNSRINALTSVDDIEVITDFVRGDGTEYTSYSFGAAVPVYRNIHLSLNYRNYADFIFERRNIYSAGTFSFGVYYVRKIEKP
ncbi:hypothetical protein GCM10027454_30140 [Algoriphagus aestuariicola]|jgi:hypothetical protein